MRLSEIEQWLREDDPQRLEQLWTRADDVRRRNVGSDVHLRGLIELSNYCVRECHYCGVRAANRSVPRYRLTIDEALDCVRQARQIGMGTAVLQAGEDDKLTEAWVTQLVSAVKSETDLAVTLSLGERSEAELAAWRDAGADRYLLRFETSNRKLFDRIHPPRNNRQSDRLAHLRILQRLGYETGSGVMIGIPGQSYGDLAADIDLFRELNLSMIGVGPYLPHPETPLGRDPQPLTVDQQVPNTAAMTCKVVALTRCVCPQSNIPATTALNTLDPQNGYRAALQRGANVIMINVTPMTQRRKYEIYPAKACLAEQDAAERHRTLCELIESISRSVGSGRGDSVAYQSQLDSGGRQYTGGKA